MKRILKEKADFVTFCIEEYAAAKGKTGDEAFDYFKQHGVIEYLIDCYAPLHTQGSKWLVEEVDEYISHAKLRGEE